MSFPIVDNTIYLIMESYSFVVISLCLNLFEHFFPFFHFYLSTSSYVFLLSFLCPPNPPIFDI